MFVFYEAVIISTVEGGLMKLGFFHCGAETVYLYQQTVLVNDYCKGGN